MNSRLFVFALSAFGVVIGLKVEATTWHGGASGDLADPANWNLSTLTGNEDIRFETVGEYTLSKDMRVNSVTNAESRQVFDFSSKGTTLTIGTSAGVDCEHPVGFSSIKKGSELVFRGGKWVATKQAVFMAANTYRDEPIPECASSAHFTDGVSVTNFTWFLWGYRSYGMNVRVDAKSSIYADNVVNYSNGGGNRLEICDGAKVYAANLMGTDYDVGSVGVDDGGNEICIYGEGTKVRAGKLLIGHSALNGRVVVTNRAEVAIGDLAIMGQHSSLETEGAKFSVSGAFSIQSSSNVVSFVDGEVSLPASIAVGGDGNTIKYVGQDVRTDSAKQSVGTVGKGTKWIVGKRSVAGYRGEGTHFDFDGDNATYFVEGGRFECSADLGMGYASTNLFVEVSKGGVLSNLTASTYLGGRDGEGSGVGNTLRIGDSGRMEVASFRMCNHDNQLVISNGTVEITGDSLHFGWPVAAATNNAVCLEGNRPVLRISKSQVVDRGGRVVFAPSASGGFAEAPLQVDGDLTFGNDSVFDLRIEDCLKNKSETSLPLVSCTGKLTLSEDVLDSIREKTADNRCKLEITDKAITLKIVSNKGFVFIGR